MPSQDPARRDDSFSIEIDISKQWRKVGSVGKRSKAREKHTGAVNILAA